MQASGSPGASRQFSGSPGASSQASGNPSATKHMLLHSTHAFISGLDSLRFAQEDRLARGLLRVNPLLSAQVSKKAANAGPGRAANTTPMRPASASQALASSPSLPVLWREHDEPSGNTAVTDVIFGTAPAPTYGGGAYEVWQRQLATSPGFRPVSRRAPVKRTPPSMPRPKAGPATSPSIAASQPRMVHSAPRLTSGRPGILHDAFLPEERSACRTPKPTPPVPPSLEPEPPPAQSPAPLPPTSAPSADEYPSLRTAPQRGARVRAMEALESALALSAESYVELAFEATAESYDDAAVSAASCFDHRHLHLTSAARRHLVALAGDPTRTHIMQSARGVCRDISRNRYVLPEYAEMVAAVKRKRRARRKKGWQLENSIWAERYQEHGDFFESNDSLHKLFLSDWKVAVRAHDLGWLIVKSHHDPNTWRDIDRNGVHDEVDEVRDVLQQHARTIYGAFEYYSILYSEQCTSHGEPDIYNIALNGYMRFVDQCQMLSKRCPHGIFETIWAAVNATDMVTQAEDRFNSKASLNRQEWLQVLVRCAIAVHIQQGRMGDVSDAVSQLMTSNLVRNLPAAALQNSNAFRKRFCYVEKTSNILQAHFKSLMALYNAYAEVDDAMDNTLRNDALMSIGEWLTFISHVGLIELGQLSTLAAKNIFIWSRMRHADKSIERTEAKLRHLTLVDFLEALVRLALTISLPTDLEIEEAGAADAGEFLLAMHTYSPKEYQRFLKTHQPKHKDPDGSDFELHAIQPSDRCVEHLIKLIIRTVEHNKSKSAGMDADAADGTIETHEAANFLKRRMQRVELSRFEANASLVSVNFEEVIDTAAMKKLQTAAAITIQLLLRGKRARQKVAEQRRVMREQEEVQRDAGAAPAQDELVVHAN